MDSVIVIKQTDMSRPQVRIAQSRSHDNKVPGATAAPLPQPLQSASTPLVTPRDDNRVVASEPDTFLSRFGPRINSHKIGKQTLQLEVGTRSDGPSVLTQSQDPTLLESLKTSGTVGPAASTSQQVVTGTVIRPDEALAVRVGFVSGVNLSQVGDPKKNGHDMLSHPDAYVGVSYGSKEIAVNTEISQPTAQNGQRRIGAGLAVSPVNGLKLAVSYQASAEQKVEQQTLKVGAEVFGAQDVVVGVNMSSPIQANQKQPDLAAGVYLNTRFSL